MTQPVDVLARVDDRMVVIKTVDTWQVANRIVLSLQRAFPAGDFAWRG
jgi:hypothetical protein